jgi:hypothetical protein
LQLRTDCPKHPSMNEFRTFRSVVDAWASKEAMASATGAKPSTVSKWWQRDNIPAEWWSAILSTELALEKGITADLLARLAAREEVRT